MKCKVGLRFEDSYIVGSSNGLVCLAHNTKSMLKKTKKLITLATITKHRIHYPHGGDTCIICPPVAKQLTIRIDTRQYLILKKKKFNCELENLIRGVGLILPCQPWDPEYKLFDRVWFVRGGDTCMICPPMSPLSFYYFKIIFGFFQILT